MREIKPDSSDEFTLTATTQDAISGIADKVDEYIMGFLEKSGFYPKRTSKYIKGLQARLKKKGLELRYFSHYNDPIRFNGQAETFTVSLEVLCVIEPIERDPQLTAKVWHDYLRRKSNETD